MLEETTAAADETIGTGQPEDTAPAAVADTLHEPFSLHKERFLLSNINTRTEKRGEDRIPALDLTFKASMHNSVLTKIHPDLRAALYAADATTDFIDADHMPHLRFKAIGSIPYDLEIPRTKLRVHDCDSEANDVVLIGGRTNKFKLHPLDGGSVEVSFRVQVPDYDTHALAALALVQNQVVPISLTCESADAEQVPDHFEQVGLLAQTEMSDARKAAEDLFSGGGEAAPDDFIFPDDLGNVAELQNEAVIAAAEAESEPAAPSNVEPIRKPRVRRQAAGAE